MISPALTSLAVLKVNADRGGDYISTFVPFVAAALFQSESDVISISEVQSQLKQEFGLDIPQGPPRTILDRSVRDGFARRDAKLYVRNLDALRLVPAHSRFFTR